MSYSPILNPHPVSQSGSPWGGSFTQPALVAGSAIIGKVGIDQTTPGTTNAVSITNASLAVTGTFWQTTQPVSGTVTINAIPTGANVIGGVTQSGTWNIGSITTLPALATGSNVIGSAKITDGVNTVGIASGTAAASELLTDRLKVNAELRLLDTAQTAGSQLVPAKGDQTTGLWVNVKNNASTTSDTALTEQMSALVASNYAIANLLAQLLAVCRGAPTPGLGDEGDALIGEYLDRRNNFPPLAN